MKFALGYLLVKAFENNGIAGIVPVLVIGGIIALIAGATAKQ